MHEKKVLIVEDDEEIAVLLEIHLGDMGCTTVTAPDGAEGLRHIKKGGYSLIILDIMLPEHDGFALCREARKAGDYTPILMLTSKTDEFDKVLGLELGADDYVTKPFGIRELIARVKAIFRRMEEMGSNPAEAGVIEHGALSLDHDKRKVTLAGERLNLTNKEYGLLHLLASNPGKTFTREDILREIWGYSYSGYEHTVNSHINRLRAKIEKNPEEPRYILTTWGVGYRFSEEADNE